MKVNYVDRREKLMNSLEGNSIVIIFSGNAPMKSLDEAYPFCIDRNFFYMTGIDRENMILLIKKENDKIASFLYIERYDEVKAKWVGPRMLPKEATSISGIKNIRYIDEYEEEINGMLVRLRGSETSMYMDLWKNKHTQGLTEAHLYAKHISEEYPYIDIKDIYGYMAALRAIKDEYEIGCVKKAIGYTKAGFEAMLAAARPDMNECELEAVFDYTLFAKGIKEHSFKSIVAGGKRATTLHYSENCEKIKDNELVLVDIGYTDNHYSSDISRTFPVNGTYTDRQKEIYSIVLMAQRLVFSKAKSGVTIKELNDSVKELYHTELTKLSLIDDKHTVDDYYYHNISHQLGLDTHDIASKKEQTLKPGMIITVEPGLYIAEEGIGIRIEDDILITEGDAIVLSKDVPREIKDIERIMRKKK